MNIPILSGQGFSTFSHTKTWHPNAAFASLHTATVRRNQQRRLPDAGFGCNWLICTFSDRGQSSRHTKKNTRAWTLLKTLYIVWFMVNLLLPLQDQGTYGNKLWGMNLKGFGTTDSRGTEGEPMEPHGCFQSPPVTEIY